jgi:hypothetical protein
MILMTDKSSEMSVHFDTASGNWITVYVEQKPRDPATSKLFVVFRTAKRLIGPWSRPRELFSIPEMDSTHSPDGIPENLFCYAGKAHPQFAQRGELIVSYVCNLFATSEGDALTVLEELLASPGIYRPRVISIEFPH